MTGPWLEVTRGKGTARVFLPRSRVVLRDHMIRVAGTLTEVDVEIAGAPGDEEALERLAEALVGVGRDERGMPGDVPEGLRQLLQSVTDP